MKQAMAMPVLKAGTMPAAADPGKLPAREKPRDGHSFPELLHRALDAPPAEKARSAERAVKSATKTERPVPRKKAAEPKARAEEARGVSGKIPETREEKLERLEALLGKLETAEKRGEIRREALELVGSLLRGAQETGTREGSVLEAVRDALRSGRPFDPKELVRSLRVTRPDREVKGQAKRSRKDSPAAERTSARREEAAAREERVARRPAARRMASKPKERSAEVRTEPRVEQASETAPRSVRAFENAPRTPQAARTESVRDLAEVIRDVVREARFTATERGGEARLEIADSRLGRIRIAVDVDGNRVTGRLLVESAAARDAILENREILSKALASSGMELSSFSVDVDAGRGYELEEMVLQWSVASGGEGAVEEEPEQAAYRVGPMSLVDLVA